MSGGAGARKAPLEDLERALGMDFRQGALLRLATTHRSVVNEVADADVGDNERLEFLGDAVLGFVVGEYLYRALPDSAEGELTALRSALVRESALAGFARRIDLGKYLWLGRGEDLGGRDREGLLGDAFEAFLGALYLDQGLDAARDFALRFIPDELEAVRAARGERHAKSRLQELTQARWQATPTYETVAESGPDHAKRFVVRVMLGERALGSGEGASKAEAASRAAQAAIDALEGG